MSDSNTMLLIHSDTTDGSTTFADSSPSAHTVTPTNTRHESDQSHFGSTSIYFTNDTAKLSIPASSDFYFSTNIYTIDFWVYPPSAAMNNYDSGFIYQYVDSNNWFDIRLAFKLDNLQVRTESGGSNDLITFSSFGWTANTWQHVAIVRDNGTLYVFLDGTLVDSTSVTISFPDVSSIALDIGQPGTSYTPVYYIDELRISNVARWTSAFTPPTSIYGSTPASTVTSWINEIYGFATEDIQGFLDESYLITTDQTAFLNEVYGLRLGAFFNEYYGNAPIRKAVLNEIYGVRPLISKFHDLKYGFARELIYYFDEIYRISPDLRAWINENYSIAEKSILSQTNLIYDLMDNQPASSWSDLIYAINADSVIEAQQLEVYIDGTRVYPFHVNFEFNRGSFKAFAEIHLADQESYLLAIENQSVLRIKDGLDDLYFQVEVPRELATPGETTFMVPAESKSRILERTEGITEEWTSDLASSIASELAGRYGITVSWEIDDWTIQESTLYANDETPYQILKKIADVVKAKLQPTSDGNLRVVRNMDVDTTSWDSAAPTYYMTDQANFFQTSEDVQERPGYNKYRASDYVQADYFAFLEYEDLSTTQKEIKGFKIPYTGKDLILGHSGGSWVTLESFGWTEETITETIEIVQGSGSVSKPIYEKTSHDYQETNLGAITYNEDGTITTDTTGQSLVEIVYVTKYWKWIVTDAQIEDVQFWLEEDDE